jgi:hypothetical protein
MGDKRQGVSTGGEEALTRELPEIPGHSAIQEAVRELSGVEDLGPDLFLDAADGLAQKAERGNSARRARGRPPGAANLRNERLFDYLEARGFKNPVVRLMEIISADPFDLCADAIEALKLQIRASEALLPYMLARKAQALTVHKEVRHVMLAGDLRQGMEQVGDAQSFQWLGEAMEMRDGDHVSHGPENQFENQVVDTTKPAD